MAWKFGNYPLAPPTRTDPQTHFQIHHATFSFDLISKVSPKEIAPQGICNEASRHESGLR